VLKYCDEYDYKEAAEKEFDEEYGFTLSIREHREDFCEEPKTKMTDVKKKTLLRDVLPAALKLHSERLNVDPVKDMLKLPFKEEYPYLPNCTNASIPKDHRKKGISNADFMLYVGLTEKYVPVQICSKNEKDRPTSALIKFVPEEIDDTRHFIRFAAHEVAHALGFDIETIKNYINVTVEEKETGKKIVRLVKAPIVLDKMKGHYGCSDDDKCDEVIKKVAFENEPGKDAPLHWERRIAKDELMSTYSPDLDVTGAYYTALTLAVFHSMPFYRANFEMAENMSWGKVAGCDFLEGKDKDIIITERPIPEKYSEMFCNEMEAVLECTSDRFALGRCTKLNGIEAAKKYSPVYLQFSPETDTTDSKNDLTDGYPIIKPIHMTSCENGNVEYMPGSVVGNMSRCLKG
ncbi:surface protease GP63, partial [Trypanosoma theileri]